MGIKEFFNRLWGYVPPDPVDYVEADATGFVVGIGAQRFTVPWEKVASIAIQHLGGTGDAERTHYLLRLEDRELRISLLVPGMKEFIDKLHYAPRVLRGECMRAISAGNEYPVTIWQNPVHGDA